MVVTLTFQYSMKSCFISFSDCLLVLFSLHLLFSLCYYLFLFPEEKLTKVKINPTTPIQEALNQACTYFRISPSNVSAYFGAKVVDLTSQFRMSGVPANATIRLKEAAGSASMSFVSF